MTGFEVYKRYIGIKTHFQNKYDFIKYRGIVNVKYENYENRHDKLFFDAIAKKIREKELTNFLVANFIEDETLWIGELLDNYEHAIAIYRKWQIRINKLYQNYEEDLDNIISFCLEKNLDISEVFKYNKQNHPIVFRFMLEEMIEMETFIILNDVTHFIEPLQAKYEGDLIWDKEIIRINKYMPFVRYDLKRVQGITNSKLRKSKEA